MSENKVLIATLHRALNYGAYLQAYALHSVLKDHGLAPYFLDLYVGRSGVSRYRVLYNELRRNPMNVGFNAKKVMVFNSAEKKFCNASDANLSARFSAMFVGSDEVWNVTNRAVGAQPAFFGLSELASKKFTYAPSVGNATEADILRHPECANGIKNFDLISVRDESTLKFAQRMLPDAEVFRVLDPTFLHDFSIDEEFIDIKPPYIAIYTYGMNKETIADVKNYANRHGLKLVSAGFRHSWCDYNYACTPFQFLTFIKNSECVVTDSFHGTIFAMKYRKNFMSLARQKPKVVDLVQHLGLADSLIDSGSLEDVSEILTDYTGFDDKLCECLDKSHKYIDRCCDYISEP